MKDTAEANTLDIFKLNYKTRLRQDISKHIRQRILLINEPEPEPECLDVIKTYKSAVRYLGTPHLWQRNYQHSVFT